MKNAFYFTEKAFLFRNIQFFVLFSTPLSQQSTITEFIGVADLNKFKLALV